MKTDTEKYWKLLPLAYQIHYKIFGEPKSNADWANGFNIRDRIIKTILENETITTVYKR